LAASAAAAHPTSTGVAGVKRPTIFNDLRDIPTKDPMVKLGAVLNQGASKIGKGLHGASGAPEADNLDFNFIFD
jgi:hypothetical protein